MSDTHKVIMTCVSCCVLVIGTDTTVTPKRCCGVIPAIS